MVEFAEHTFRLDQRQGDGRSLREHLESLEKQTGKVPALLIGPDLDEQSTHLWGWFLDLHVARGSNGFGPSALSYSEILAWATLTRVAPTPWEVSVIKRLDAVYLCHAADESDKRQTQKQQAKGS